MKDPKRLIADSSADTAFQRKLLASYLDEAPSPDAKNRTLLALGISALAGEATASPKPDAPAGRLTANALRMSISMKTSILVFVVVSVAGSAGYRSLRSRAETSAGVVTSNIATSAHVDIVEVATVSATATVDEPVTIASHAARTVSSPKADAPDPRALGSARSLAAELTLIERARTALQAGDSTSAIARVEDYDKRYKNGSFAQEAKILRIQALVLRGDRASARAAGEDFLRKYPSSPHADTARRILSALN